MTTMSVLKSITLLTLLLSVLAAPFVAADVAGGFMADAAFPSRINLSNVRIAVADPKVLVDKATSPPREPASRIVIKSATGAVASSTRQTVARRRVIGRAIDCGLDRALLALRPHWPNAAMGDKALADLVAVVDRVSVKNPASADGGRL
jgi:hypothetical protein